MKYTHLGLSMVVIFLLFLFGGYKLDEWWGTSPTYTVVGIIAGVIFGFGFFIMEIVQLSTRGLNDRDQDASDS